MADTIGHLFSLIWLVWFVYWMISARGVKPVQRRESVASRAGHIVPLAIAVLLLVVPTLPLPWLTTQILPQSATLALAGPSGP